MRARRTRLVAIGVLVPMAVGTALALTATASSPPALPAISTDRLIASAHEAIAAGPSVSGHATVHVDLGIPQVVDGPLAAAQPGVASLLGDHRLRIWRSPDGLRVTELLPVGERALFVDRTHGTAWAWDSTSFSAYRLTLGEAVDGLAMPLLEPQEAPVGPPIDPIEAVRAALSAIAPSTEVRAEQNATVAGRDAYVLSIEPRTDQTLIGRIEVAIDAERRLPLSIQLLPRSGGRAAFSAAFTDVGFGPIDPSVYAFSPPEGAVEKEISPGQKAVAEIAGYLPTDARAFGEGWTTIVALELPAEVRRQELFSLLPFTTSVLSIRAVPRRDHVWIVYGSVPPSALAAVEPKLP